MRMVHFGGAVRLLGLLTIAAVTARPLHAAAPRRGSASAHAAGRAATGDVIGLVTDSTTGGPLSGADITISKGQDVVARISTDMVGRFVVHNLPPSGYDIEARLIGYHPQIQHVTISAGAADITVVFRMVEAPLEVSAVQVSAATPIAVNTRTGDQVFKQDEFQGSPTLTTSQIVQQAIAGAARAPTGEVHIRGQHAEYSYYVDGIPVPAGISGSLNELFDPSIVNQIDFQTGGWDAEYGNKNAAIINVTTRIPSGKFHWGLSGYGGNYSTNGQTLTASGNSGKLGLFFSGTRQVTDLRREPVQGQVDTNAQGQITTVHAIQNFANHGEDLFGFAKMNYSATDHDVLNIDANWSRSRFQTPFDSAAGIINDRETDVNGFLNVGYTHRVVTGSHAGTETFISAFYRHGSLNYVPGVNDAPSFTFAPDTTPYNIAEQRSFNLYGIKADYAPRVSEDVGFKFGVLASLVRGSENFQSFDSTGAAGPASNSPLNGTDVGVYAQTQIQPNEQWELRAGIRYDNHSYPITATTNTSVNQVSPRIKLSFFPSPATTLWAYYGRQFVPTNTEDLRNITSASTGGVVSAPTLPERDNFFEVGLTHRFRGGVVTKLSAYHKQSDPGIDDTQVPGTAITTDVNIDHVRITGLEGVLEVRPRGPVSGFLNVALNHAYGYGAVSGGFFSTVPPAESFDLDHDQRLSTTAGLTVSKGGFLGTLTGIYGSGLTNGLTPNAPGVAGYDSTIAATGVSGTGLFDFNKEFKVKPSFILNGSVGYAFAAGRTIVHPQLYVDNIFNLKYSLKGAFFSGATFGRPRTYQLRLSIDM